MDGVRDANEQSRAILCDKDVSTMTTNVKTDEDDPKARTLLDSGGCSDPDLPKHPLFHSRDFYVAAYLHLLGVPLLYTRLVDGRVSFTFNNQGERAYTAFLDYQADNGNDVVPLKAFRAAYRHVQDESRKAKEAQYHDNTNRN